MASILPYTDEWANLLLNITVCTHVVLFSHAHNLLSECTKVNHQVNQQFRNLSAQKFHVFKIQILVPEQMDTTPLLFLITRLSTSCQIIVDTSLVLSKWFLWYSWQFVALFRLLYRYMDRNRAFGWSSGFHLRREDVYSTFVTWRPLSTSIH